MNLTASSTHLTAELTGLESDQRAGLQSRLGSDPGRAVDDPRAGANAGAAVMPVSRGAPGDTERGGGRDVLSAAAWETDGGRILP